MKIHTSLLAALTLSGCLFISKSDLDARLAGDADGEAVADTADGTDADADEGIDGETPDDDVPNTAPQIVGKPQITPGDPTVADTLTATVSTFDAEAAEVSLSYIWYINGEVVSDESTATLDNAGHFVKGDHVVVLATPNDGVTDGTAKDSEQVTIINSAPSTPSVSIDTSESTCHSLYFDGDDDRVRAPDSEDFVAARDALTIEAWINWDGDTGAAWYPVDSSP